MAKGHLRAFALTAVVSAGWDWGADSAREARKTLPHMSTRTPKHEKMKLFIAILPQPFQRHRFALNQGRKPPFAHIIPALFTVGEMKNIVVPPFLSHI